MKLAVAIAVLCVGACERKKPVEKEPAPSPAPPAPTVVSPPPEPPRPGTVELEVTGAVTLSKKGTGSACGFGRSVGSQDVDGFGVKPAWRFWVNENANDPKLANASFTLGETEYEWTGDGAKFRPYEGPSSITFDEELASASGAKVRVRASITCPTFPTAPVPKEVAAILAKHTKQPVRAYSTYDYGREEYPAAASVTLPEAQGAAALAAVRGELPEGYVAFLGTNRYLGDEKVPDDHVELVIAPGASQSDIIRTARTDGINYGIQPEAIARQVELWDRAFGIDVTLASADTVVFALKKLPADVDAFAKEVYAFCPDIVTQGVGSVEALAKEIRENRELLLWWD